MDGSPATWQLGHRAGLDGLRGVAVLLVVFGHLFYSGASSWLGGTGVVVFFVLSGFLITSLLMEEFARSASLSLPRFYARRARRLGPALAVMVAAVAVIGLVVPRYADWPLTLGTLTWSANWVEIWQRHHGLAGGAAGGTPLAHAWSLAVEEQFYLLWPLILPVLARRGRPVVLAATGLGVAVTAALPLWLHDRTEIYYGSFTRAMPLLLGCLLAAWMHGRRERRTHPMEAAPALGALLIAGVLVPAVVSPQVVAVLSAVAILAVARGAEPSFLHARWLGLVGRRSYGLYLWHWPIYVLVGHVLGAQPWVLAIVALPAAVAATALSWRYVEAPFLKPRGPRAAEVAPAARQTLPG